jgi:hypothetical protein
VPLASPSSPPALLSEFRNFTYIIKLCILIITIFMFCYSILSSRTKLLPSFHMNHLKYSGTYMYHNALIFINCTLRQQSVFTSFI